MIFPNAHKDLYVFDYRHQTPDKGKMLQSIIIFYLILLAGEVYTIAF